MILYLKQIKDEVMRQLVDGLAALGKELCDKTIKALEDRGQHKRYAVGEGPGAGGKVMNVTYNLHDSIGWGVYLNGQLVNTKYGQAQKMAGELKKWEGRRLSGSAQIKDFLLHRYKPERKIVLVIAAAMPYGKIIEEYLHYTVISDIYDELRDRSKDILDGRRIRKGHSDTVRIISIG